LESYDFDRFSIGQAQVKFIIRFLVRLIVKCRDGFSDRNRTSL
jgi:hypothetical protein